MSRWCILVAVALLIAPRIDAAQKPQVVLLEFGGKGAQRVRRQLAKRLARGYRVLPGADLLAACQRLGIAMSRGANLARCASHIGAIAVVGGTLKAGRSRLLSLAVYSGATGQVIHSASVRWRGRRSLRGAVRALKAGLNKAPPPVAAPKESAEPEEALEIEDDGEVLELGDTDEAAGERTKGAAPNTAQSVRQDPPPASASELDGLDLPDAAAQESQDNPLVDAQAKPAAQTSNEVEQPKPVGAKEPEEAGDPNFSAWVGLGVWLRNFELQEQLSSVPSYDSGAAFALALAGRVHPAGFFTDGIVANFFLQFHYQMAIGLSAPLPGSNEIIGNGLSELVVDVGYRLDLFGTTTSPRIDFLLGFGMLNFSVDWPAGAERSLPNVDYQFARFGAGLRYPFLGYLGVAAEVDYRFVFQAGELQDDAWFGPGSVTGFSGKLAAEGSYWGIIARLGYAFGYYSASFDEPAVRNAAGKRAAAGATDLNHTVLISAGYSF